MPSRSQARIVHDINQKLLPNLGSYPKEAVADGTRTWFVATTAHLGEELYLTSGTAATTRLVKDCKPGVYGSSPKNLTVVGTKLFFSCEDGIHGTELWVSDGTEAGTILVKDINPGGIYSDGIDRYTPSPFLAVGALLYFVADDGATGRELWKSDGTELGTVQVKDIIPGAIGSAPDSIGLSNGRIYFSATSNSIGKELWTTDGTLNGTYLIKDIYAGASSSKPAHFTPYGTKTLFSAEDSRGNELWITDGTATGTAIVADVLPGSYGSNPAQFISVGGTMYFVLTSGTHSRPLGYALYKTDGTSAGTSLISGIYSQTQNVPPAYVGSLGNQLLFAAQGSGVGRELFITSGTRATTRLVHDVWPLAYSSLPHDISALSATKAVFVATTLTDGKELWVTDGTSAGTSLLKDIHPGSGSSSCTVLSVQSNGLALLSAYDGVHGFELWVTDGTSVGTKLVKDLHVVDPNRTLNSNPQRFEVVSPGVTVFMADDGVHGAELWRTDGTSEGTFLLKDANASPYSSGARPIGKVGSTVFFSASDGHNVHGTELWKTDGTIAGTTFVKDTYLGARGGMPTQGVAMGGKLYFTATTIIGRELWFTDGTETGTSVLKDIAQYQASGVGSERPTVFKNRLYFLGNDQTTTGAGAELWCSDGSSAGTVLLKDINLGSSGSGPRYLTVAGDLLYFQATEVTTGAELWVTDGTSTGTHIVKDIGVGSVGGYPTELTAFGNKLCFRARNAATGSELWISDGTAEGTHVLDLVPGSQGIGPIRMTVVGNQIFFLGQTAAAGREPWVTDGTLVGSRLLLDIEPGATGSWINRLHVFGSKIIFFASNTLHGSEPYVSDGTVSGTGLLQDIWPGTQGSAPNSLTALGGKFYFSAVTPQNGSELWVTDGSPAGTRLLQDIREGPVSSAPWLGAIINGKMLFRANGWTHGSELWMLDPASAQQVDPAISEVSADDPLISSCRSTVIHVTPKLTSGAAMGEGQAVSFATTAGILGAVTYEADVYSVTLTGTMSATSAVVTATVNGRNMLTKSTIGFVPVSQDLTQITADVLSTVTNGLITVRIKALDCLGVLGNGSWTVELLYNGLAPTATGMTYLGNGIYEQKMAATAFGTSKISARIAGLPIDASVTVTVINPANLGNVIGLEADSTLHSYASVQDALNHATKHSLTRILVSPGTYEEKVKCEVSNIVLEGLSATHAVVLRGLEVEECSNVQIKYITIKSGKGGDESVEIEESNNVSFYGCTITGIKSEEEGIEIEKSTVVRFVQCYIHGHGGDGIAIKEKSSVWILDCLIESNGKNGIKIKKQSTVTVKDSTIRNNGTNLKERKGYGIYLKRSKKNLPTSVTLIRNVLSGNRGKVVLGKSTRQLANFDQILDSTDTQTSY